ncbi:hypothetical protein [Vibrio variabilis]|uniref:hypothetical protein n=1 Tax=Vibrio variabilis TaxID=990271 RepID=UPI000DD8E450|nr:hypothetical protein [Vibrio variabilis]
MNQAVKRTILLAGFLGCVYVVSTWGGRVDEPKKEEVESLSTRDTVEPLNTAGSMLSKDSIETVESDATMETVWSSESLWQTLLDTRAEGNQSFDIEKRLIEALKRQPNTAVYNEIRAKLLLPDDGQRTHEYLLSLLASINTPESVAVLLEALGALVEPSSDTIYAAKQSLRYITRSDRHMEQLKASFAKLPNDSLYLGDLARGIAQNAAESDLEFLIAVAGGSNSEQQDSKVGWALSSMSYLSNERLVPQLKDVIASKESTPALVDASLESLAMMGQYEAGVALIEWSTIQSASALPRVERLIVKAQSRSPSMTRAIDKTLHRQDFNSEEVRTMIERLHQNSE